MHRTHIANAKSAATLWLSAVMFCGLASAQAPSNLFQRIPVSFEENRGQFVDDSRFLIHATNARIKMKATQLEIYRASKLPDTKAKPLNNELQMAAPPVVMSFVNANSKAVATPSEESPRKSYYIFNDGGQMPKVITATHFRSVRVANLYPGIDAVYYDKAGEVEYDLIVQPSADPKQVRLHFGGAATAIDANGNINIGTDGETVIHRSPVVYQGEAKSKSNVASRYVRNGDGTFGIELGTRDASKALTIDPVISFATFLAGSSDDSVRDITTDSAGRLLAVGKTSSFDFPIRGNLMPNPPNAASSYFNLGFVTRFNRAGTDIEFSTFVAVDSTDFVRLDDAGNIYVAAQSNAQTGTIPAGLNAYKPTGSGAYVLKLSPNGDAILGATYMGTTTGTSGFAVNGNGTIAISGGTSGTDGLISTTPGAWFSSLRTAFIAKLQPTLGTADFVTYAPEAGPVAIDAPGNVYIAGGTASSTYPVTAGVFQTTKKDNLDVFVTKLNPSGGLLLSTLIGANKASDCYSGDDWATSLALATDGSVYIAGRTMSSDSPSADNPFTGNRHYLWNGLGAGASFPGSDDSRAFLLKLSADFSSVAFSGSIMTTNQHHTPINGGTQASCFIEFQGRPAKVAIDNAQNIYLIAGGVGDQFPALDNVQPTGDTVLIVNSSGQRIGATKLTGNSNSSETRYTVNPATGAIYFSAKDTTGIQSTTGLTKPRASGAAPLMMKLLSPLARVSLDASNNPSAVGQTLTVAVSALSVPTGGIFILKRDGLEVARSQPAGLNTTFTVSNLQAGFYAFTASYELPDLAGTITSKTLAQAVAQTAVCP
jgi:hypothetical protein